MPPGNTRAHAQNRARRARARADWYSGHSRDRGTAKIAQQSLGEGYVCFPQLAPIPMSDILYVYVYLGAVEWTSARSRVHLRA